MNGLASKYFGNIVACWCTLNTPKVKILQIVMKFKLLNYLKGIRLGSSIHRTHLGGALDC